MIIFGTRAYVQALAMVNFICNNCHNPAAQRVMQRVVRFTLFFIPFLKYPANPPSIGNSDTIGRRTTLYLILIALSLLIVVGVAVAARQLAARFGTWNGAVLAVAAGIAESDEIIEWLRHAREGAREE